MHGAKWRNEWMQNMGANSKIEWTDHTFNPWVGCTKISPACDHCYAEAWAKRAGSGQLWQGERRRTTEAYWRLPLKWNAQAAKDGVRRRVFCASLADVFDNQVPDAWRYDLWQLIGRTPNLDWLLLTKRPQNIVKMLPEHERFWPRPNIWLGTTVENQDEADRRIPYLLEAPAAKRFLSCEPLLGPINLTRLDVNGWTEWMPLTGWAPEPGELDNNGSLAQSHAALDWVICGGESGPGARAMSLEWARNLRDQCAEAGVPFFMKQIGGVRKPFPEIPEQLMIRQFPSKDAKAAAHA